MKIPNTDGTETPQRLSLARIVSEDSQQYDEQYIERIKSSKDS